MLQKLWSGEKVDINCQILEYSTPYNILRDKFGLFTTDRFLSELQRELFDHSKYREMTHSIKYQVWKYSISNRVLFEIVFIFFLTLAF